MNDLLASEAIGAQLFYPDPLDPESLYYSLYSLGLMLGLLAVALNLAAAAIAAVNAALACHFSIHHPPSKPSLEARIVFCMLIQFIASAVAGISLVLLCIQFDFAFTIVIAVLFFSGIVISAYHLISLFGSKWFKQLRGQPLHAISLVVSTVAFCLDVPAPSPISWFTITIYGVTVAYHMVAILQYRPTPRKQPRRLATFVVMAIAAMWVGCAALKSAFTFYPGSVMHRALQFAVVSLAGLEALVLLAIGTRQCVAAVRWNTVDLEGGSLPH